MINHLSEYEINQSGIYKIQNLINGKVYIGSTNCFRVRWNTHKSKLRINKHFNYHLQSSWNKYGEDIFRFEIVEFVTDLELLHIREQVWIDTVKSYERKNGYNIIQQVGKPNKIDFTDEIRRKMSLKKLGIPLTDDHKLKMSQAMMGKRKSCKLTEDDVLNIRILLRDTDLTNTEIANIFGVNSSNIGYISQTKSWEDIIPRSNDFLSNRYLSKVIEIQNNRKPKRNTTKLNEEQVKVIKLLIRDTDLFHREIGEMFDVARQTISSISLNKKWSDITVDQFENLDFNYLNQANNIIERR